MKSFTFKTHSIDLKSFFCSISEMCMEQVRFWKEDKATTIN